jgi:hypothetical protein
MIEANEMTPLGYKILQHWKRKYENGINITGTPAVCSTTAVAQPTFFPKLSLSPERIPSVRR